LAHENRSRRRSVWERQTSLIEQLVAELKRRGLSVAVIKHCSQGFSLDQEGKDSWRFKEAGADG
jgi:molybdopterin-guanine dinucleotide biosynthesis protein B